MKPLYFILPAVILAIVAVAHISQQGAFDAFLKDKTQAVEQEASEELAALQNIDLDSKLAKLNRARQLQGLPTYNLP